VLEDAKRLGVADQVHFPGARLDAEPYFTACDLFVLPSRLDPFPCVVHEAMACAKPVIAFAGAGGAPEALADGAGIVVDYGDAEAMAGEVWRLACDAEARRALGERARARVASAYVFADYVDRLAEVIAEGTGVDLGAPIDTANGTVAPKRVFFTAARWEASGRSAFVASLIEGLGRRGFAAELVLTGRGPILHALEDLPDVPTTILPDTLRRSMSHRETWRKLTALLGGAGTAVFIPVFDEAGAALTPILPPRVGALEIAFDGDPGLEERVMRLGRYWQRMTAVLQSTAETALTLAPGLLGRIEAIPWEAGGSDLEAVCDRYAQLLDQMFAELRAGAYVRPPPAFIHPELGGISLPPSLVLHPDLAPPGRPPR